MTITALPGLESLLISPPKYLSFNPGSGHHHFSPVALSQPALHFPIYSPFHSQNNFPKCPCEHITLLLNLTRFYNAWLIKPQLILLDLLWTPHSSSSHPENISTPQTLGLDPCSSLAWITLLSILPCLPPASGSFSSLMSQLEYHFF